MKPTQGTFSSIMKSLTQPFRCIWDALSSVQVQDRRHTPPYFGKGTTAVTRQERDRAKRQHGNLVLKNLPVNVWGDEHHAALQKKLDDINSGKHNPKRRCTTWECD
jgi:hypothetical protein